MALKKSDNVGRNVKFYKEEPEQEEIPIEVDHNDVELHNQDEVEEEAQVTDEDEEMDNDYMLARDR